MKVAYILNTPRAASYKVQQMILPQLEAGTHGVDVVGIFFFDDNAFALRSGDPIGERLAVIAKKTGPGCCSWPATSARWSATSPTESRVGATRRRERADSSPENATPSTWSKGPQSVASPTSIRRSRQTCRTR